VWRAQKTGSTKEDWSIIAVIVFTVFYAMTLLRVGVTLSRVEYRLFVEEKAAGEGAVNQ
jgi:hypothetical protein